MCLEPWKHICTQTIHGIWSWWCYRVRGLLHLFYTLIGASGQCRAVQASKALCNDMVPHCLCATGLFYDISWDSRDRIVCPRCCGVGDRTVTDVHINTMVRWWSLQLNHGIISLEDSMFRDQLSFSFVGIVGISQTCSITESSSFNWFKDTSKHQAVEILVPKFR